MPKAAPTCQLPPALARLREAVLVMNATEVLAIAPRGWSLEDVAEIAGEHPNSITREIDTHVSFGLQAHERMEAVCHFLSSHGITPPGGWSVDALAKLSHCDRGTMHRRISIILASMRSRLADSVIDIP